MVNISGVTFDKPSNKFITRVRFQGKTYFIGRYISQTEAVAAKEAAVKVFSKFNDIIKPEPQYIESNQFNIVKPNLYDDRYTDSGVMLM